MKTPHRTGRNDFAADVCLILEGTYPYVPGGVSSWVHQLIRGLSDLTFTGMVILPSKNQTWERRYELPPNMLSLDHVYIHDYQITHHNHSASARKRAIASIDELHDRLAKPGPDVVDDLVRYFLPSHKRMISVKEMLDSKQAWDMLVRRYDRRDSGEPFLDYFWTFRFTHLPIFQMLEAPLPKARVYHTVSTGYAGLLGSLAAGFHGRPLILTEHGIYTKERKMEIAQAEWIYLPNREEIRVQKEQGAFQRWWIQTFETLGRLTYQKASAVTTLFEENRRLQVEDGCPEDKTRLIPNGIDVDRFQGLKADPYKRGDRFNIGLVGRVVPIKDVKTFIRACKLLSLRRPDATFFVIGPTDEDEAYYRECLSLADTLGLGDLMTFTGNVDMAGYYPDLDMICLTSASEAQPLVVLEANCVGIPVVATDVGACAELLQGRTAEDRALGASGLITPVTDPWSTSEAMLRIIQDDDLRSDMIRAGRERVFRYYQEKDSNRKYRELYDQYLNDMDFQGGAAWPASASN